MQEVVAGLNGKINRSFLPELFIVSLFSEIEKSCDWILASLLSEILPSRMCFI